MKMFLAILLLIVTFPAAICRAGTPGLWGSKEIAKASADERLGFRVLTPKTGAYRIFAQWILRDSRSPRLPARRAACVDCGPNPSYLVIEAATVPGIAPSANLNWIISNGYFTRDANRKGASMIFGKQRGTDFCILYNRFDDRRFDIQKVVRGLK
jgi:hypothetical protein